MTLGSCLYTLYFHADHEAESVIKEFHQRVGLSRLYGLVVHCLLCCIFLLGCSEPTTGPITESKPITGPITELEGPIRAAIVRSSDGNFGGSRVQIMTPDGNFALVFDNDTEFVDDQMEPGILELGHIYRARTVPIEFAPGTVLTMGESTKEIVRVVYMERLGPGPTPAK